MSHIQPQPPQEQLNSSKSARPLTGRQLQSLLGRACLALSPQKSACSRVRSEKHFSSIILKPRDARPPQPGTLGLWRALIMHWVKGDTRLGRQSHSYGGSFKRIQTQAWMSLLNSQKFHKWFKTLLNSYV